MHSFIFFPLHLLLFSLGTSSAIHLWILGIPQCFHFISLLVSHNTCPLNNIHPHDLTYYLDAKYCQICISILDLFSEHQIHLTPFHRISLCGYSIEISSSKCLKTIQHFTFKLAPVILLLNLNKWYHHPLSGPNKNLGWPWSLPPDLASYMSLQLQNPAHEISPFDSNPEAPNVYNKLAWLMP